MTVFFDFNGTILDDVDLCFNLLNEMLIMDGHEPISKRRYLDIFTFPILEYYQAAGFTFEKRTFAELAHYFIEKYQPLSLACQLHEGLIEAILELKKKGYQVVVLSASQQANLVQQLKHFKLDTYFDDIIGIQDIYAESKIEIAQSYVNKHQLKGDEIIVIGDTLHDLEVAKSLGAQMIFYTKGHQAKHRFKGFPQIDHFKDLEKELIR